MADIQDRLRLLTHRVRQMLSAAGPGQNLSEAQDLTQTLEREGEALVRTARSIEQMEASLLTLVGERLFAGEPEPGRE